MISAVAHVCAGMRVCVDSSCSLPSSHSFTSRVLSMMAEWCMCVPSPPSCEARTPPFFLFHCQALLLENPGHRQVKGKASTQSQCLPRLLVRASNLYRFVSAFRGLTGGLTGEACGTPPLAFRGGFCLLRFAFAGAQVGNVRGEGGLEQQQLPKLTMKHYLYLEKVEESVKTTTAAEVRGW